MEHDTSSRFRCLECQQTFGRVEHLTRHSRSHTKERFLKCQYCRKGFYRVDALRRHEQTHKESRRSVLGNGARACVQCAGARRKCSGGTPCAACGKRQLECCYPDASRPGRSGSRPQLEQMDGSSRSDGQDALDIQGSNSLSFGPTGSTMMDSEQNPTQLQPTDSLPEVRNEQNPSESWYEGNITSLNWLPYNWNPDFEVGVGNTYISPEEIQSPDAGWDHAIGADDTTFAHTFAQHVSPPVLRSQNDQALAGSEAGDTHGISSPGSHSTQSTGHYYVDGDGARLPRVRRVPYQLTERSAPALTQEIRNSNSPFYFPNSDESLHSDFSASNIYQVPLHAYKEISNIFNHTCITSTHYPRFSTSSFPSLAIFSKFIQLYIENFQSLLPFIHPATFDLSAFHWLLALALAAAGSHYIDAEDSGIYSIPMHEFLRRAIQTVAERGEDDKPNFLVQAQAKLLNCVGMMYSGDEDLTRLAKSYHYQLVSFCGDNWTNGALETEEILRNNSNSVGRKWKAWYEAESRRRTGYCIWLLDCMWAFHFQTRPFLSLKDAKAPIPCQEVLWEADSAIDWDQLYSYSESPSLHSTIQLAYIEKRIQSSTGEFSRILCIHALFRRTWEVDTYFTHPLTLWEPTAERQDVRTIERSMPVWLPNVPTYSKWRNSACDCLDILHWHANSVIGAASGMEHPTVLHLHLARVILLTPFRRIVRLAERMSDELSSSRWASEIKSLKREIQRWAIEDQYKARLAVIHAGVLFWHVRRYSIDAFYEPSSVYLATLALWAYGRFAARTSGNSSTDNNQTIEASQDRDEDNAGLLFPTSMQLDRPADDELVQLFVKRGMTMQANIMGVGNLCSRTGHVKVLVEGRKLLTGLKKWGHVRRAIKTLDELVEVCQRDA